MIEGLEIHAGRRRFISKDDVKPVSRELREEVLHFSLPADHVNVLRQGEGKYAEPGQYIVMNMLYKDSKDSIWNDTRKNNIPAVIQIPDAAAAKNEKGIESIFRVLKKGDSVLVKVTAKSLYETWRQPVPLNVKSEGELTFLFGVTDIIDQAGLARLQEKIQGREFSRQLAIDTVAIDAYLAANNIKAIKDKSGLRYVITQHTLGDKPQLSNIVVVNYKGSLMEGGKVFDQSNSPIEYPLTSLIRGWQIGFPLLSKGAKATLYIPSTLSYGPNGHGPDIPPNANLVFEVELIDFK